MIMHSKTASIVITFNPDRENLLRLLDKTEHQLNWVLVVDNGSQEDIDQWLEVTRENVEFIPLKENLGIAQAQNIGIRRAKELGADYVVLFDQDSNPEPTTLPGLVTALEKLLREGHQVGCVGPRYVDSRQNNPTPFIRVEGLRLVRTSCDCQSEVVPVDHLIASGSLIPIKTLDIVGGMKEELFIDYVDLEWCERALAMGYQTYGVCSAKMDHALGDEPIQFLGTAYPARSPLRHYYMFRNAFWMYRQNYVRWNWKVVDALRLLRKYVFYTLFAKPRYRHLQMMTKGMWHGLIGKMGRFEA
jgi:rhamnosyltransferase